MDEDRLTNATAHASCPSRPTGVGVVLSETGMRTPSLREQEGGPLPTLHHPRQQKSWTAGTVPPPGVPFTAVSMFVDIRDSTTLTNQLGIMAMTKLVTEFFTAVADLIEDERGTVCGLYGDGALALFRSTSAADRSLSAAIRILELASAAVLPDTVTCECPSGRPLTVGIGIDQGQVCQARIPCSTAPQQSWIGVNTANKLASIGRPRQSIAITEEAFAEMADPYLSGPMLLSPEKTMKIGDLNRVVRTLTAQPPAGPC
jgi:class 3 adenylate cyclase